MRTSHFLLLLGASLATVSAGGSTTEWTNGQTGWTVENAGDPVTLDPDSNGNARTRFEYKITVGAAPWKSNGEATGLSHWVLGASVCAGRWTVDPSSPGAWTTGLGNQYDFQGIKDEFGAQAGVYYRELVVVSSSSAPVAFEPRPYLVKGGTYYGVQGNVFAPTCETTLVPSCTLPASVPVTCQGGVWSAVASASPKNAATVQWSIENLNSGFTLADDTWMTSGTPSSVDFTNVNCMGTQSSTISVTVFSDGSSGAVLEDTCTAPLDFQPDAITYTGATFSPVSTELGDVPPVPDVESDFDSCNPFKVTYDEHQSSASAPYILTRSWTATQDNCDSDTMTVQQVITVVDTTPPVLAGVAPDETADCATVPPPCEPVASDLSDDEVLISFSQIRVDGGCTEKYTLIRTWTARDGSGNEETQSQTIVVDDNTPPHFTQTAPDDQVVECDAIPAPSDLEARDLCTGPVTVQFDQQRVEAAPGYKLVRTWTAVDACGNKAEQKQTITVEDNTPPLLTEPDADETVPCTVPPPCIVESTDNCDGALIVTLSTDTIGSGNCHYQVVHTWTATDAAGNSNSKSQTVTVSDDVAPVIKGLHDTELTAECDDVPNPQVYGEDNCHGQVTIVTDDVITNKVSDSSYTITRTWTAYDECGNSATKSLVITVIDSTDPTLSPLPTDVSATCIGIPDAPTVIAADNCCVVDDVNLNEAIEEGTCDHDYVIVRTWSVNDCYGNSAEHVQRIAVTDTDAPELINTPGNLDLNWVDFQQARDDHAVDAEDDCGVPSLVFTEDIVDGSCPKEFVVTQIWTATDACGNVASHSRTISVSDPDPPTFDQYPSNLEVQCDAIPPMTTVIAHDIQDGEVDVVESHSDDGAGSCNYKIFRTWSASDECGNQVEHTQTITVSDGGAPFFECANGERMDNSVGCDETPLRIDVEKCDDVPDAATLIGSDACHHHDLTITLTEVPTTVSECWTSIKRTWSIVDACGNIGSNFVQYVHIKDELDPLIEAAPAIEHGEEQCYADLPDGPIVSAFNCEDGVGEISVGASTVQDTYSDCDNTVVRRWTATDSCGHSASLTQTIVVDDTTDPTLPPQDDSTYECGQPAGDPVPVEGSDNCVGAIVPSYQQYDVAVHEDDGAKAVYAKERQWQVADACGNSASEVARLVWYDTTDPLLQVDVDVTVECDDIPLPSPPSASDTCSDVSVTFTQQTFPGCNGKIVRTWTAVDESGNSAVDQQTVTFVDSTPPTFTPLPDDFSTDVYILCDEVMPPVPPLTPTDNCDGEPELDYAQVQHETYDPSYEMFVRTWTATDACGNVATEVQTVYVTDDEAPVIDTVIDQTLEFNAVCSFDPPYDPDASDNCNAYTVTSVPAVEVSFGPCQQVWTYRWTAVDAAGNGPSQESATYTVEDNTPPTWTSGPLPDNESFTYSEHGVMTPDDYVVPTLTADDSCGVTVTVTPTETPKCGAGFTLSYVAVASDPCGNEISHTWVVTYTDDSSPTLENVPDDYSQSCADTPPTASTSVTYNGVVVPVHDTAITPDPCEDVYTVTYTYRATNDCNYYEQDGYSVSVTNAGPSLTAVEPVTVRCDRPDPFGPPTATDDCTQSLPITEIITTGTSTDPDVLELVFYEWSVADACGMSAVTSSTVTVEDKDDPVLVDVPTDSTAAYQGTETLPPVPSVECTDECSCTVTYTDEKVDGTCIHAYAMLRTWTATDAAGHVTQTTQTITVSDTVSPTLNPKPGDMTIDIYETVPVAPTVTASDPEDDLSDLDLVVDFTESSTTPDETGQYVITRSWYVSDACGNTAQHQQIITVVYVAPPPIPVYNIRAECHETYITGPEQAAVIQAAVDADPDFPDDYSVVFTSEVTNPGSCTGEWTVVRTFTGTDSLGNSVQATATVTVYDDTAPTFAAPLPVSEGHECQLAPPPTVTATDNCIQPVGTNVVTVTYEQTPVYYGYHRVWTATDDCGFTTTHTVHVYVVDPYPPTFTTDPLPVDQVYECTAPPAETLLATDNCGPVDVVVDEVTEMTGCGGRTGTIIRTWSATDAYDQSVSHTVTVTVQDTRDPNWTVDTLPQDGTMQCGVPVWTDPEATDECPGVTVTVSHDDVAPVVDGLVTTYTRTWTASDQCGSVTHSATITVEDTENPTIDVPVSVTLECDAEAPEPPVNAYDDCGAADVDAGVPSCEGDLCSGRVCTTIYTATDGSGNTNTSTFTVTFVDTEKPTVAFTSQPSPEIYEGCIAPPEPSTRSGDNCADTTVAVTPTRTDDPTCGFSIFWTAVATDECGIESEPVQSNTAIVRDSTPPAFDLPVPANSLGHQCSLPSVSTLTASDTCGGASVEFTSTSSTVGCKTTEVRDWTATDDCGNTHAGTQTVSQEDTTPPTVTAPADLTIECNSSNEPEEVYGNDNCDGPILATVDVGTITANDLSPLYRTYTVTDLCGNTASDVQTFSVYDVTPPTVNAPADITVDCVYTDTPSATATDDCGEASLLPVQRETTGSGCGHVITYTFSASDAAGNIGYATMVVTVKDSEGPQWSTSLPEDVPDALCEMVAPAQPEVDSNCDGSLSVSYTQNPNVVYWDTAQTIVRSWSATDSCGRTISHDQTITIVDDEPPVITHDGDVTVNCDDTVEVLPASAADNCDLDVSASGSLSAPTCTCAHECEYTITYTSTDKNGNTGTSNNRKIFTRDNEDPVLTFVPSLPTAPVERECSEPSDPVVTASDNCDVVTPDAVTWSEEASLCKYDYSGTKSWSVSDDCGNTASASLSIIVTDGEAPTLTFDSSIDDLTVECDDLPPVPSVETATDNCASYQELSIDRDTNQRTDGTCVDQYTLTHTWTVTDPCGLFTPYDQVIAVSDTTAPELTVSQSETIDCHEPEPPMSASATDNCGDATVSHTVSRTCDENAHGCFIFHTWSAVDACGNAVTDTATVSIIDTTPPEWDLTPDDDVVAGCHEVPVRLDSDTVASDNCGPVTVNCVEEVQSGTCDHSWTITRTCTATDSAGNSNVHVRVITVIDDVQPDLVGVPAGPVVIENGEVTIADVTATDNCDPAVEVHVTQNTELGTCDGNSVTTLTWDATDDCGNTNTATQQIEIIDTEVCIFDKNPEDVTVECDSIPAACEVICENPDDIAVVYTENQLTDSLIVRRWSHTDSCGNSVSHEQSVTIVDSTKPKLSRTPADEEVQCDCDTFPMPPDVYVLDNCDENVDLDFTEFRLGNENTDNYAIVRTWTATDNGQNTETHSQTITVTDNDAPVITGVAESVELGCSDNLHANPAFISYDNCDEGPLTQGMTSDLTDLPADGECSQLTFHRTFHATDRSGNKQELVQTVTVVDSFGPTKASDGAEKCLTNNKHYQRFSPAQLFPDVADNCGSVSITVTGCGAAEGSGFSAGCQYYAAGTTNNVSQGDTLYVLGEADGSFKRYYVTATLTDACGNESVVDTTINVYASVPEGKTCKTPSVVGLPGQSY